MTLFSKVTWNLAIGIFIPFSDLFLKLDFNSLYLTNNYSSDAAYYEKKQFKKAVF